MLHIFGQTSTPVIFEGFIIVLSLIIASIIMATLLTGIAQLLLSCYNYIMEDGEYRRNPLMEFMDEHINIGIFPDVDSFGKLSILIYICLFSIIFYKLAVVGTIIWAMMWLSRSVVRLKSALTKHIDDKKAHK